MFAQYTTHNEPFTLKIQGKLLSLSGGDFSIKTLDDRKFMSIEGEVFSIRAAKTLMDERGAPLLVIKRKLLTLVKQVMVSALDILPSII